MTHGLPIDFNSVAAFLAHADSKVQADFLNTFAKELQSCCKTRHAAEMQMAYAAEHLSEAAKDAVKMLAYEEPKP